MFFTFPVYIDASDDSCNELSFDFFAQVIKRSPKCRKKINFYSSYCHRAISHIARVVVPDMAKKLINIAGHVPEELEDPDLADQMFRQEQA